MVHVNVPAAIEQSGSDSLPTVPGGIGSESTTPAGICDGPPFVAVIVYVVDVPATTVAMPSVFVSARSPWMTTASVSVAALSDGSVSAIGVDVMVAVFTSVGDE